MQNKSSRLKVFIGGLVIGTIAGLLAGGFTVATIMANTFINTNL